MSKAANVCAERIVEVIPFLMGAIRTGIRLHPENELSMPQFRALAFAERNEGARLAELADHLGMMVPAASKVVDGLVVAGMLERKPNGSDRRRIKLVLTGKGRDRMVLTRTIVREFLSGMLSTLSGEECDAIRDAMNLLGGCLEGGPQKKNGKA